MNRSYYLRLCTAPMSIALAMATIPAWADSTSSASSAASTSAGSASESLGTSSNSSSKTAGVAQGTYTVLEVADVAGRPDMLQLTLQAQTLPHEATVTPVQLRLPRTTVEREQLASGHNVQVQHRPYGLALATLGGEGKARPFFLVLDDAWHRELHNRPVGG